MKVKKLFNLTISLFLLFLSLSLSFASDYPIVPNDVINVKTPLVSINDEASK